MWQEATLVAALAYSIGSRCQVNADGSMLAGLLHNVGKLYILARANRHGSLFRDRAALAFRRLALDNAKCAHIMQSCGEEISALRTALGD